MQKKHILLFFCLNLLTLNALTSEVQPRRTPTIDDILAVKGELVNVRNQLLSKTIGLTEEERMQLLSPKKVTTEQLNDVLDKSTLTMEEYVLLCTARKGLREINRYEKELTDRRPTV
ncbi:MAG: hypothetical protein NTZ68_02640 [Candidatus Dependentiae bacterium]|nr:hypothetical protein [Candidatus Dependentiae bacterium]